MVLCEFLRQMPPSHSPSPPEQQVQALPLGSLHFLLRGGGGMGGGIALPLPNVAKLKFAPKPRKIEMHMVPPKGKQEK